MPQPDHISALPVADPDSLDEDLRELFALCVEKLGIVPNVLRAYSLRAPAFQSSNARWLQSSCRAPIPAATARCAWPGGAPISGNPELGEMLVMNHHVAPVEPRQRAMLDLASKLATAPATIGDEDRAALRQAGLGDEEIFDLPDTVAFFNISNRMASVDIILNPEYHRWDR